jgi:hypothetical protein
VSGGAPADPPAAVVQRQLDAYNARDLARFVECFREDVRVFRPPAPDPALTGRAQLAEFYATQRFDRPALRADLLHRALLGARVVDHERIYGLTDGPLEMVVVYEVKGGAIATMWSFAAA